MLEIPEPINNPRREWNKEMILHGIFFILTFVILFVEYYAAGQYIALCGAIGRTKIIELPWTGEKSSLEGQVVHISGPLRVHAPVTDPKIYSIKAHAVKIKNVTSWYSRTRFDFGWKESVASSTLERISKNVSIVNFELGHEVKEHIDSFADLYVVPEPYSTTMKSHAGFLHNCRSISKPQTGDKRMRFYVAGVQGEWYTVTGKYARGQIGPYISRKGETFLAVQKGEIGTFATFLPRLFSFAPNTFVRDFRIFMPTIFGCLYFSSVFREFEALPEKINFMGYFFLLILPYFSLSVLAWISQLAYFMRVIMAVAVCFFTLGLHCVLANYNSPTNNVLKIVLQLLPITAFILYVLIDEFYL